MNPGGTGVQASYICSLKLMNGKVISYVASLLF